MHTRADRPFVGWRVIFPCFLAQNLAIGFAFGSFGPLLASTEQHFGVTRSVAAAGMSLIMLAVGGLSPLLGGLLQKMSVRSAMIGGAALSAVAYLGLAVLPSFGLALLMFGFIGTGVSILAVLGPLTLINRWFASDQAKVLSIVNLPIALFVTPFMVAELLPEYGRFAILGGIATIFLLLICVLMLIVEDPGRIGQAPRGINLASSGSAHEAVQDQPLSTREILTSAPIWLVSVVIGIMSGAASAYVVHIVPFGMERDLSLQSASGLISVYAGAGILGTLLFGWIADRIGPPAALMLATFSGALMWWGLLHVVGLPLFAVAGMVGICLVPLNTLHGAALSKLVGVASISRVMGISYGITLPFILGFAPLVGILFEYAGGYTVPFLMTAGTLIIACLCSLLIIFATHKQQQSFEAVADH